MKGVVPAAGRGTRLRPLTDEKPKGLVEVAGSPILTHCFEQLRSAGVSEFVVVVGYRGEQIREYYGEAFEDVPITYVRQPERRGLGDAVLQARPVVDDAFLVLNGDNVTRANVDAVADRQLSTDAAVTLLVERVSREAASRTGVCRTDEQGRLTRMVEKPDEPPSRLVVAGCYGFEPVLFEALERLEPSDRGEYELTDAIDALARDGHRVETVPLEGWRINVNTERDVERASDRL